MLDGFQYVLGQIGVVLVITALLATLLGWFLGRGSRQRNQEALERAIAAATRPATDASAFAPSATDAAGASGDETTDEDDQYPTHRLPYGVAPIDRVPLHDGESGTVIRPAADDTVLHPSDATVLRPAGLEETATSADATVLRPPETTVPPAQDGTVLRPVDEGTVIRPVEDGTVIRPPDEGTVLRPVREGTVIREAAASYGTVIRSVPGVSRSEVELAVATVEDGPSLRPDLRDADLQIGVVEAAALAAWDRTVPLLEQQVKYLAGQNDELRHMLRDAQERLDSDGAAHLRAVSADAREHRARA